jgi:hypothetical protein
VYDLSMTWEEFEQTYLNLIEESKLEKESEYE